MTPTTMSVLKEAVEILNRIQGKENTNRFFKELRLVDLNNKPENKNDGSRLLRESVGHGNAVKG